MRIASSGLTLVELLVVVAIIAALIGLGLPAMRTVLRSFQSEDSSVVLIQTALNTARSMAMGQQRYIGIRFQHAYCPPKTPLEARQYLVFIAYSPDSELASRFRAVRGLTPIPLPEWVGVMDMVFSGTLIGRQGLIGTTSWDDKVLSNPDVLRDISTVSIVFGPSGRLAFKEVCVRDSGDMFNSRVNVRNGIGMFVQDDTDTKDLGLAREESRDRLLIYDRQAFNEAWQRGRPLSGYLNMVISRPWYVNSYSGNLVQGR